MKESTQYIIFFKKNLFRIFILPVLGLLLGLTLLFTEKPTFYMSRLFEVSYDFSDINQEIALADQAVTVSRSYQVLNSLVDKRYIDINIHKPSPLSISVEVGAKDRLLLIEPLNKISDYLVKEYKVKPVGEDFFYQKRNPWYILLALPTAIGLVLGVVISLIREYFHSY